MFRNKVLLCAYLWATVFTATLVLGQHHQQQQHQFYRKPWPTYSLQNMPQTQFTCHDKILGGYYADAETQCQMFHVCVKVAGVGVQDFRFLCPNGTAFDQEAQICADWGDVDCEQSVLYYGSDNFDLYRIGSGFESKRAPLAEEEEATFHLQRAESADVRRSKETRVDQKSRPEQPPNYTKHYELATTRNFYANHNYGNLNVNEKHLPQKLKQQTKNNNDSVKKPIANFYTPTTSTTTTSTTTTERSNNIDESRQDFDDIFKGSHSSHFFSNRNGGREDELLDYNGRSKQNSFADFSKKAETSTSKTRLLTVRPRRVQTSTNAAAASTTTTTTKSFSSTTFAPTTKKLTLHTSYNADSLSALHHQKKATISTTKTKTTSTSTTRAPSNANRFNLQNDFYLTQEKIQPTTYNPGNNIYRFSKTTPTPKYNDLSRDAAGKQQLEKSKAYNKPTASARKIQKLERTQAEQQQQQKLGPRNSTYVNKNEFTEFVKIKAEQPKPFQPVQTFRAPLVSAPAKPTHNQEPQYYRTRAQQVQQSRVGPQDPAPFSAAPQKPTPRSKSITSTTSTLELSPRGFANRGSINYKASTQRDNLDSYSTSTTQAVKKFSTLVPREHYTPTTFKPSTTHKSAINNDYNFYLTQQTIRPVNRSQNQQQKISATTTTTAAPTIDPYYNPDEDDGQYRPELYELDFPRNRLNLQRQQSSSTTTKLTTTSSTSTTRKPFAHNHRFDTPQTHLKTQQQSALQKQQEQSASASSDLSDEDELFKTAHSLNFGAASINKLRADIIKAEKTSQQYNSQYSPNLVQSSSPKVTAPAPSTTPSSTTYYTFHTTHSTSTTAHLFSPTSTSTTTTTTTTSTKRPFTYLPNTTNVPKAFEKPSKPSKPLKPGKVKGKGKKSSAGKTATSKHQPHADEDTSYDYAYYDTDTLSESPQEYPEYEISEFTKTRKN